MLSRPNLFDKIRCNYLLSDILSEFLEQRILLNGIRYNNQLKKKFNISIIDYKNFYLIEIDIRLMENIPSIIEKKYFYKPYQGYNQGYHIYFNNSKTEVITQKEKHGYLGLNKRKINKILLVIDKFIDNLSGLFNRCEIIEEINFIRFNRKNITQMQGMFKDCYNLKKVNLSKMKTDNVTDFSFMFQNCYSLEEINCFNFKTNNLKYISEMFSGCKSAKEINVSNFFTRKIDLMNGLFFNCSILEEIDLIKFDTINVTDMNNMFAECHKLINLDISNFKISPHCTINGMFVGCSKLLQEKVAKQNNQITKEAFN